ncbi:PorP/SprF family type IX secretion system membrane protein [Xanthovirga aplysinae]|uniref:PorP/SprF family type IX secretion system membrane protein n=1 Tax=Xanthovirga aplysinae TaxID=2529853 RepID=UPI0012BD2C8C|nr:type IX secretion system membrane protein PorP/SprF [Xanthovirga aplysinae]MTI29768.1 type IX secretion system membrane protein PorP/SprF [Xanthovirga aplysinae]
MRRKFLKAFFLLLVLTVCHHHLSAQQQAMFTQYMFNPLLLNPAYAGSHEAISVTALIREQWVGLEGAPKTQTFSFHAPIPYRKIGVGMNIIHDRIGVTDQISTTMMYAYRLKIGKGKLSMGLQASYHNYRSFYSRVSATDPSYASEDVNSSNFNFGTGIYYYTDRWYVSASVPQLLNSTLDNKSDDPDSKLVRHYFITGGVVLDLNRFLKLKPNILLKAVSGAPIQMDLNANLLIYDTVWLGLSYRSLESFDALTQFQLTPQLLLGYSFDFATTTALSRVNSGSHEISVNYRFSFSKKRRRVICPTFF